MRELNAPDLACANTARRAVAAAIAGCALAAGAIAASAMPAWAEPVRVEAPQAPNFADVVDAVSPAVVSVKVDQELAKSRQGFRFDRRLFEDEGEGFFRDHPFFRDGPRDRDREGGRGERRHKRFAMSQGSGFLVSADGFLVTNHHVVENGSKFTVVMGDGAELEATLVGADARTDLAVLKVQGDRPFTYVKFSEDRVRVGEWVVAVGNPFGLGGTVTAGIVSAHSRAINANRYDDFLQIDAAVNRGNSGGPAFNLKGEVIGVNNAILSPSGGNVGIAFAIPAASASAVVRDLIENGRVVRGWLGVQIQPVTRDIAESVGLAGSDGVIVSSPQEDSPAAAAGIRAGDIITAIDGEPVANPRQLARRIAAFDPESRVRVTIWRSGASSDIEVTLGALREDDAPVLARERSAPSGLPGLGLELSSSGDGVAVDSVLPGSDAVAKGVRPGDLVVAVNGRQVRTPGEIAETVAAAIDAGRSSVLFQIVRGGNTRFVALSPRRE